MEEMTTHEAAEALGLKERTIRHYVHVKRLVPSRRIGSAYMFSRDEINRFKALPRKSGPRKKPKD